MSERRSIFTRPAGPRAKWVVFAVWLVGIFIAAGPANLPGKFTDAENNESTSYLPGDAESTEALEATEELQGGELVQAVIVYRRASGLTPADRERIVEDVGRMTEERFEGVIPDGATAAAGGEAGGPRAVRCPRAAAARPPRSRASPTATRRSSARSAPRTARPQSSARTSCRRATGTRSSTRSPSGATRSPTPAAASR
jgi:hypothetical protein